MNDPTAPDQLDLLAEDFLQRLRRGERPRVYDYIERFPELAEQIEATFRALEVVEGLKPTTDVPLQQSGDVRTTMEHRRFGDYQILREIGRGGMGVVFEAEQISLGRRVALKVLSDQMLADDKLRQRFEREARAAAKLHHTNIVPVFGFGECEGIVYYVMQFIEGFPLDQVVEEVRRLRSRSDERANRDGPAPAGRASAKAAAQSILTDAREHTEFGDDPRLNFQSRCAASEAQHPIERSTSTQSLKLPGSTSTGLTGGPATYWRSVAGIGAQVADALDHAHKQGVLHRDVKPSNLLLDSLGTVWITDFGLAKADDHQDLTNAGDIVGTLRYMAPERFNGECDGRSDSFALGLTLYEFLTFQPAFGERDRRRLIKQVIHESPPRPRSINSTVPRDLETIVLKAIARAPENRYQTAKEFAEDLRRFANDVPIRARRTTRVEHLFRWCRRNPAAATLAAVATLLLAVLSVGLPLALMLESQRRDAVANLGRAEKAENENRIRTHLAEAKAVRRSGKPGQSLKCLEEIAKAASLHPAEDLQRELRNEALAAYALLDARPAWEWTAPTPAAFPIFDQSFKYFAWCDPNGTAHVCRTSDKQAFLTLKAPHSNRAYIAWSPNAQYLALSNEHPSRTASVWSIPDGKPILQGVNGTLFFTGDSKKCVVWQSLKTGEMQVIDAPTGRAVRQFRVSPGWHAFAPHPDGRRVAVSSPQRPTDILDVETGRIERTLALMQDCGAICWHANGNLIAGAFSSAPHAQIRIVDLAKNQGRREFFVSDYPPLVVSFSQSGQLLCTNGWDETLRIIDWESKKVLLAVPGCSNDQTTFFSGGRLVGSSKTGERITVWEIASPDVVTWSPEPESEYGVDKITMSHDGRMAAVRSYGIVLTDFASRTFVSRFPARLSAIIFPPDESCVFTAGDDGLQRWPMVPDLKSGLVRIGPAETFAKTGAISSLSLSADGRTIGALENASRRGLIIDVRDPNRIVRTDVHPASLNAEISPDARWLVTGPLRTAGQGRTIVWDARTGAKRLQLPPDFVSGDSHPLFSPDGRWLLTATPQIYQLWSVSEWIPTITIQRRDSGSLIGAAAFSPDSQLLAVARSDQVVQLLDPNSGREIADLETPDMSRISSLAFSRDGAQLTAGRGKTLTTWDLRRLRRRLKELGLDWGAPEYPPARPEMPLVRAEVIGEDPISLNNLAWKLANAPPGEQDLSKALLLARKAARLKPNQQTILNTLGVVEYRNGLFKEALATLTKSEAVGPGEFEGFDRLAMAMCHHHLGDSINAKDCYDRGVRWGEENLLKLSQENQQDFSALKSEAAKILHLDKRGGVGEPR